MEENEREYLLSRAEQEMKYAASASSHPVRSVHEAMARRYAARAALIQPETTGPAE